MSRVTPSTAFTSPNTLLTLSRLTAAANEILTSGDAGDYPDLCRLLAEICSESEPRRKRRVMATFIILGNYTAQGIASIKDSPGRLDAARARIGVGWGDHQGLLPDPWSVRHRRGGGSSGCGHRGQGTDGPRDGRQCRHGHDGGAQRGRIQEGFRDRRTTDPADRGSRVGHRFAVAHSHDRLFDQVVVSATEVVPYPSSSGFPCSPWVIANSSSGERTSLLRPDRPK